MIYQRMKFLLSLVLAIVACSTMVVSAKSHKRIYSNSNSNSGANICVIKTSSCNTNSTDGVCGRYGRSNLCKKFSNNCDFQMSSCSGQGTKYKQVSSSYCSGIAVNQRRRCNGLSSSSSGGIFSNLFGSNSNSNSNVTPIIIRT